MKIETFTLQLAVADDVLRGQLRLEVVEALHDCPFVIAADIPFSASSASRASADKPTSSAPLKRKKRKYTRHVKPAPASDDVPVRRAKRADGTVLESRGNCPGGGAAI